VRVTVGGMLAGLKQVTTRAGGNMAFVNLEDQTGQVEVVIFPRVLTACSRALKPDSPLLVRGRLQNQEEEVKLLADEVLALPAPVPRDPVLYLKVAADAEDDPAMVRIRAVLERHRGTSAVRIKLEPSGRWIEVHAHLRVTVTAPLLAELESLVGKGGVATR